MNNQTKWYDINEYSRITGKSISTIRRHIKNEKINSVFEDGKYLIEHEVVLESQNDEELIKLKEENIKLKKIIEELNELKTLVMVYEDMIGNQNANI